MASIFRQSYTAIDPKTSKRVKKKSKHWYVGYTDSDGIRRRVKAYTDKDATRQMAARLEKEKGLEREGIIDPYKAHRKRPLAEHLKDFKQSLISGGGTVKNAELKTARIQRVFDFFSFAFIQDISASRVSDAIGGFRKTVETGKAGAQTVKDLGPISTQSKNHYLQAVKQFCRWLVKDRRAADNPLAHLSAGRVVKTAPRRAMTADEIKTLLNATENGPDRNGMTGPQRSMLYRLAVETGLRASELAALKVSDIDLAGRAVTLADKHTKNRQRANLPLRADTVERLGAFLSGKTPKTPVFRMPRIEHVSKIFKADLTAAGIDPADDGSGKLDFHALRHSFASLLAQSGVDVKTAQTLLRHSTPVLTLGVYTHTLRGSEQAAVDRLPGFDSGPETERQKATGTDGKSAQTSPDSLTHLLTHSTGILCKQVSSSGINDKTRPVMSESKKNPLKGLKTGFWAEKAERRRRDSNPRNLAVQRFSRPSP